MLQDQFDTRRLAERLAFADPLFAVYPEARFIVRVEALRIYPKCPRYVHKNELFERSRFVPYAAVQSPVPVWKHAEWARDVLSATDPARVRDD